MPTVEKLTNKDVIKSLITFICGTICFYLLVFLTILMI